MPPAGPPPRRQCRRWRPRQPNRRVRGRLRRSCAPEAGSAGQRPLRRRSRGSWGPKFAAELSLSEVSWILVLDGLSS
eukprot:8895024-Pyramimonas_sp.AAC.1